MPTLERPLKEGNVRTYQQKVALGFPDILASEADADLDTIYAAWNGGIGTATLLDNSVTSPKIAESAVGTRELADNLPGTILAVGGSVLMSAIAALAAPIDAANFNQDIITLTAPMYRGGILCWGVTLDATLEFQTGTAQTWLYLTVLLNGTPISSRFQRAKSQASSMSGFMTPCPMAITGIRSVSAFAHTVAVQVKHETGDGIWHFERGDLWVLGLA